LAVILVGLEMSESSYEKYIHTYFICNSPKGLFSYKRNKKNKNTSIKMNKQNGKGV